VGHALDKVQEFIERMLPLIRILVDDVTHAATRLRGQ
jgi:hypothetical protein